MIHLLFAAALAAAPAPAADPHKDHAAHEGMKHGCKMDCCKGDKPMPCCDMKAADKKADAPAADTHGGHEHDH
jgi:hypothetical protein